MYSTFIAIIVCVGFHHIFSFAFFISLSLSSSSSFIEYIYIPISFYPCLRCVHSFPPVFGRASSSLSGFFSNIDIDHNHKCITYKRCRHLKYELRISFQYMYARVSAPLARCLPVSFPHEMLVQLETHKLSFGRYSNNRRNCFNTFRWRFVFFFFVFSKQPEIFEIFGIPIYLSPDRACRSMFILISQIFGTIILTFCSHFVFRKMNNTYPTECFAFAH